MTTPDLEVIIDAGGHYLDANDELLALTGYTRTELQALSIGALSDAPADAAGEVWRGFVSGEIDLPADRVAGLRAKDGTVTQIDFLGVRRRPDGSYVSRMRRRATVRQGAPVLQYVLAEWRAAERDLRGRAPDDPDRAVAQARVDELRDRYQEESRRRTDGAGRGT